MKPWLVGVIGFGAGTVLTSAAFTAFPSKPAPRATRDEAPKAPETDEALRKANETLTASLQACDRKLAELRSGEPAPSAVASAEAPPERPNRARRRERSETTKEDWERMAQLGVVRVRIPCLRDTPWKPNERAVQRLGLAPDDVKTLEAAYAASNKRVEDQVKPLCAKIVGSAELADRIGASACMDAIQSSAKKSDPKSAKEALSRAAEAQAGKRKESGEDAAPLERLANVLAAEGRAFETDLAQKLGPEEAKRLTSDPALCSDRRVLRTSDEDGDFRGGR